MLQISPVGRRLIEGHYRSIGNELQKSVGRYPGRLWTGWRAVDLFIAKGSLIICTSIAERNRKLAMEELNWRDGPSQMAEDYELE
jgi:hypothetical protein